MRYVIVYRPPYSSLHPVSTSVFFDEFSQFLENVVMCPEALVISGDFNLHLDDLRDNDTKKFMDLLETFSLSQHVSENFKNVLKILTSFKFKNLDSFQLLP